MCCGKGVLIELPQEAVFRIEWAFRTGLSTLYSAIYLLFINTPLGAPIAAGGLMQVFTVLATFNTLGPTNSVIVNGFIGTFFASVASTITNAICRGGAVGSAFFLFIFSFAFAIFDIHPANKKLGLALVIVGILVYVLNPELPVFFGFSLFLTIAIGGIISLLALFTPCPKTGINPIADKLSRVSKLLASSLEIQLEVVYKESRSIPLESVTTESKTVTSDSKVETVNVSGVTPATPSSAVPTDSAVSKRPPAEKRPGPPPPTAASSVMRRRNKRDTNAASEKMPQGSSSTRSAGKEIFLSVQDGRKACKSTLLTQETTLLRAAGHTLVEIGGCFANLKWEPRSAEKEQILLHHFKTLKLVYAIISHSTRLSTTALSQKIAVPDSMVSRFLHPLRKPLHKLAKCLRNVLTLDLMDDHDHHHAVQDLKRAFSELMNVYYMCRAEVFYQDTFVVFGKKVLDEMTQLNMLLYSLHNVAKAGIAAHEAEDTTRAEKGSCLCSWKRCWSMMPPILCKLNWSTDNIINSLKVATAIVIASLFALIPETRDTFDNPFWAPLTIAFVMGRSAGASFKQSFLRMQGTVTGVVFGYTLLRLTNGNRIWVLVTLPIFVFLASLAKPSVQYGYAGIVTAFTAGQFVLGFETSPLSVEDYVLARVELTAIGIVIWFIVCVSIFPFDPIDHLSSDINASMRIMAKWVQRLGAELEEKEPVKYPAPEFAPLEGKVGSIRQLLVEAKVSPNIFRNPFPAAATERLFGVMLRMKRTLDALSRVAKDLEENTLKRQCSVELAELHNLLASALNTFAEDEFAPLPEIVNITLRRCFCKFLTAYQRVLRKIRGVDDGGKGGNSNAEGDYSNGNDNAKSGGGNSNDNGNGGGNSNDNGNGDGNGDGNGGNGADGNASPDLNRPSEILGDPRHTRISISISGVTAHLGDKDSESKIGHASLRLPKFENFVPMAFSAYLFHLRHMVELIAELSDAAREKMLQDNLFSEDERYH